VDRMESVKGMKGGRGLNGRRGKTSKVLVSDDALCVQGTERVGGIGQLCRWWLTETHGRETRE
jgi:hypothetical protein